METTYVGDVALMDSEVTVISELNTALKELEYQGLTIRLHDRQNNSWHVSDGGLYSGYVLSGDELIELGRSHKLNIREIMALG